MKRLKVAVGAGTSEGVELVSAIDNLYDVTAFVTTEYGKSILSGRKCSVHTGALDYDGFCDILPDFDAVVDATHPFAVEVTQNLKKACFDLDIPYFRFARKKSEYSYEHMIYADSIEEAAKEISEHDGKILFTTGVKTLPFYERSVKDFSERSVARVLDTEESRALALGISCNIVYGIPPFSYEDTLELIREHNISVLVTKDSGERGGMNEKLRAAQAVDILVIAIRRPNDDGVTDIADIKNKLELLCGVQNGTGQA